MTRLFRCMTSAEQGRLLRAAIWILAERCSLDPGFRGLSKESLQSELAEKDIDSRLWCSSPAHWPGQKLVHLDNVGDSGEWLRDSLGTSVSEALFEPPFQRQYIAENLVESYLDAIASNGFDMPWDFHDDPDDPTTIAECKTELATEFVAFIEHWRNRVLKTLEAQNL